MQMMKKVVTGLAVATGLALTAPAALADGYVGKKGYKPVAEYAPVRWSSLYFGGHLGYATTDVDWGNISLTNEAVSHSPEGWVGGGQIGLQHQWGNFVAGIELSISGGEMDDNSISVVNPLVTFSSQVSWMFTATAKVGYAWDRLLAYAKFGYAHADVTVDGRLHNAAGVIVDNFQNRTGFDGWTVGVGLEYMWLNSVSLGIEYNYMTFGGGNDLVGLTTAGLNYRLRDLDLDDVHVVKARINFHLHRGHDAPAPLK